MNRSPLHELSAELGARFTEFGGWEMPVRYRSVLEEHRAVRDGAGMFDVSHLGRFRLTGSGAHVALQRLLSNDIDGIEPGRCQYTLMLNPEGGIVDDLIVWWTGGDVYLVMPNASNHHRVMEAFASEEGCAVSDLQSSTVMLAVQGPGAPTILEEVIGVAPGRFRTSEVEWDGERITLAGTGYTGEPGGELLAPPRAGTSLARAVVDAGAAPCGLGARDTLRLEAGLPLWGEDIDETTTPLEAGLGFAVSWDHDFVGVARLREQSEQGVARRLTGFRMEERGIPRHGHRMRTADGGEGTVTSGNLSPLAEVGVGLGYLSPPATAPGTPMEVEIRGRWLAARTALPPFHRG